MARRSRPAQGKNEYRKITKIKAAPPVVHRGTLSQTRKRRAT